MLPIYHISFLLRCIILSKKRRRKRFQPRLASHSFSSYQMNSSKIIPMIAVIAFMMLLIFPIPSMTMNNDFVKLPTRHKRWTFNTWRLHGRRQLSNGLIFFYSKTKTNIFILFNRFLFTKNIK
jgi:hypothetical protein